MKIFVNMRPPPGPSYQPAIEQLIMKEVACFFSIWDRYVMLHGLYVVTYQLF